MKIGFTGTRQIEKVSALRLELLYQKIISYKIDYDVDLMLGKIATTNCVIQYFNKKYKK